MDSPYCPSSPYDTYTAFLAFVGSGIIAVGVYASLFGFSFSTSFLCLYYLFKNWKPTRSHSLTTGFTLILALYNIFVVVAEIVMIFWRVCRPGGDQALQFGPSISLLACQIIGLFYVPVFLFISDAFLLYRAWDVWVHRRSVIILPGIIYLISIVGGTVLTVDSIALNGPPNLTSALLAHTPAMIFSMTLDFLITGLIAGRLIHHHQRISASTGGSFSVLPIAVIFIESAALSAFSKVIQIFLAITPVVNWSDPNSVPFIIPLCTLSSNFIILRKALGADVTGIVDHRDRLSTIRFHVRSHRPIATIGSIPGGFESHLRTMLGDPAVESSDLDWEDRCQHHSRAQITTMT